MGWKRWGKVGVQKAVKTVQPDPCINAGLGTGPYPTSIIEDVAEHSPLRLKHHVTSENLSRQKSFARVIVAEQPEIK